MAPGKFIRSGSHLPVKNMRQTLDFYRDKLGFYDEWTSGEKDGGTRRDEMRLLFAEDPAFTNDINTQQHRLPLMWFVENIEAVYAELKAKNIDLESPLQDHSYGLREFAFTDINGYYIRVAEPRSKIDPMEG